jgi:tetratricopeptide (TPR) repeat protein
VSSYSYRLVLIFILFFSGCASSNQPQSPTVLKYENENLEVMEALEYENYQSIDGYKEAIKLYKNLEAHTNKFEYNQKAISLSLHIKDINEAQNLTNKAINKYPTHQRNLYKLQSYIYLTQSKIDDALNVSLKAIDQYPDDSEFYDIAGSLYFQKKEYEKSKKYYESSYVKHKNISSLLNLSNILYTYLDKKIDAISYLETHSRLYEYNPKIYAKLINIYSEEKDYKALASTYDRMYQHTHKEYYALKVVEIYIQTNKKDDAIKYLQKKQYQ